MTELSQLEGLINKPKPKKLDLISPNRPISLSFSINKLSAPNKSFPPVRRQICYFCEKLGFLNLYHPEHICKNKEYLITRH